MKFTSATRKSHSWFILNVSCHVLNLIWANVQEHKQQMGKEIQSTLILYIKKIKYFHADLIKARLNIPLTTGANPVFPGWLILHPSRYVAMRRPCDAMHHTKWRQNPIMVRLVFHHQHNSTSLRHSSSTISVPYQIVSPANFRYRKVHQTFIQTF